MFNKKFDFQKFDNNLKQYEKKEESTKNDKGLATVIRYVWNQYPTGFIDFNSFSYQDVLDAMASMELIPTTDDEEDDDDDDDEESIYPIEQSPWYHNMIVENACANLNRVKNKIYENDDDFI